MTNHATRRKIKSKKKKAEKTTRQAIKCSDIALSLALAAFLKTKVMRLARTRLWLCDHAASMLSREHRMHSE